MTNRRWTDYEHAAAEDTPDDAVLATNVARLRQAAGMSQTALADAMRAEGQDHWRQTTASRVERGRQRLTAGEVLALQRILGPDVIHGTAMLATMTAGHPLLREEAARRALAEAEAALAQALATVQALRALYSDDDTDKD